MMGMLQPSRRALPGGRRRRAPELPLASTCSPVKMRALLLVGLDPPATPPRERERMIEERTERRMAEQCAAEWHAASRGGDATLRMSTDEGGYSPTQPIYRLTLLLSRASAHATPPSCEHRQKAEHHSRQRGLAAAQLSSPRCTQQGPGSRMPPVPVTIQHHSHRRRREVHSSRRSYLPYPAFLPSQPLHPRSHSPCSRC